MRHEDEITEDKGKEEKKKENEYTGEQQSLSMVPTEESYNEEYNESLGGEQFN
jgi:hypothetical protein